MIRAKLKKLKSIHGLLKMGRQPGSEPREIAGGITDLTPGEVKTIHRQMGGKPSDLKLARQVYTMQQRQFPDATVPELITYIWLTAAHERFDFQGSVRGGRHKRYGLVPDFIIWRGGEGIAWRVQGTYWHNLRYKTDVERSNEASAKLRLLGATISGVRIAKVVDLWEERIYDSRPEIYYLGLNGVEIL